MNWYKRAMSSLMLVILTTLTNLAVGQDYRITWWTVDAGGGVSGGGTYFLTGTIGQPDAGVTMTADALELTGGFWAGATSLIPVPGDCDGDGDVDLNDYAGFAGCLDGPTGPIGTGCGCYDLDSDGDNDLLDFAEFQILLQQ